MECLRERDFCALLEFLRRIYAPQDLDSFVTHLLKQLPKLIPSELTTYDEMTPSKASSKDMVEPAQIWTSTVAQVWQQVMHEHPPLVHALRTRSQSALKMSDFLTQRQLHDLALYQECYRLLGVQHMMGFLIFARPPLGIGIAVHRGGRRDFSERERTLFNIVRSHLTQAWHNAKAVSRMQQELDLVKGIVEALDEGVVVLTHDGSVLSMNARARRWLEDYFGHRSILANRLPEILERWVRREENLLESKDNVPPSRKPLVLERTGRRLVVRHLCQQAQCLLLFQERQTAPQPVALQLLGISQRETEVLHWVAYGKTNIEIGTILGLSPRTVQKHLERIYQKLGVENRTAAAAKICEFTPITDG